ncbi:uncharacterized protein LOC123015846 [Tribolium madens]|uniref:uncharacterized protein LOC123015846 n=1 Tax=Tribolium madens TaxID=41895 RepID=UPI001CF72197|nr:uncharacterized protein LOC123015846 [Tribolium madens]
MSANNKFEWNKQLTKKLIRVMEGYPCLYDCKHKFYANHHARMQALLEIKTKLMEDNPDVVIENEEIKRKITNLRSQLTAEIRKITKSKHSGIETDDVYEPTIWWFKELQYLLPYLRSRKSESSLSQSPDEGMEDDSSNLNEPEEIIHSDTLSTSSFTNKKRGKDESDESSTTPTASKKLKKAQLEDDEIIQVENFKCKFIR